MDDLSLGRIGPEPHQRATTQLVSARIRDTYVYSITQPPSATHHRLWKEDTKVETDDRGRKWPVHHRRTTWTALQLAVDHTFRGSYASTAGSAPQFRPSVPPPPTHTPACAGRFYATRNIYYESVDSSTNHVSTPLSTPYITSYHFGSCLMLTPTVSFLFLKQSVAAARPLEFGQQRAKPREEAEEGIG